MAVTLALAVAFDGAECHVIHVMSRYTLSAVD
jgi:hypothetical protein